MSSLRVVLGVVTLGLLSACSPQKTASPLRSLESSGRASFLCWGADYAPRSITDCPDQIPISLDAEQRDTIALVTQTNRGEVAVVDVTQGYVVDEEPSVPGYNFLPVGQSPVSIVSTPGSVASFVAVSEVGREGIYALPTSCAAPRQADDPLRDILSWPACRLPSAPGEMAIIVDPETDQGVRTSCADPTRHPASETASSVQVPRDGAHPNGRDCPADLSTEKLHPGRRKLLVELPSRSLLAVIDAQELLDRTPGSFDPCPIESYTRLGVQLPTIPTGQVLPDDMKIAGCAPPAPAPVRDPASYKPLPAGFATDPTDPTSSLYVADLAAPVVHVLDTSDPCAIVEQAPLLPMAFNDPTRVVTTRKVALSPLTSSGKRFVYAVDELDGGSVMIFDVSPGATDRTPILRPHSPMMPFEAEPDRIAFDAPVADVTFGETDRAVVDPATGNTIFAGVECDPNPKNTTTPGSLYRPVSDASKGAQPGFLRGVFGFLALGSGQLAIIDVEDLDAKCRRPDEANASAIPNFQGCASDGPITDFTGAVSNERSCNVVERHRARSAAFIETDSSRGARSPGLVTAPKLFDATGGTLATDRSDQGRPSPRMLGVDFSPTEKAQVFIGTSLAQRDSVENPLVIDPAKADQSSLVLNLAEPRAYARPEAFKAVYEGIVAAERNAARYGYDPTTAKGTLDDSGISFCSTGVEDESVAAARAADLGLTGANAVTFSEKHADYAVITSALLDQNDLYWQKSAPCGEATTSGRASYLECRAELGTVDVPLAARELRVVKATASGLEVTPRGSRDDAGALIAPSAAEADRISRLLACCFPGTVSYTLRASQEWVVSGSGSGYRHRIATDPSGACVRDTCDPMKSLLEGRAFEVSCADPDKCPKDDQGQPAVGPAGDEVGCVLPSGFPGPIQPVLPTAGKASDVLARCIFQGLTARFVIYRGSSPSKRDMEFSWQLAGTFVPYTVNMAVTDANISIQSLQFVPYVNDLVMTDGAFQGLVVTDLVTLIPRSYY